MLELLRIIRSVNLERSHTAFGIRPMDRSIGRKKVGNIILECVIFWAESRKGWVPFYWSRVIQMNENQL